MTRSADLLRWAERLRLACEAGDWQALADADRELNVGWRRLSARGPWTVAERAALDVLRGAHRAAVDRVGQEGARVRERLAELSARKEGWMAYAVSGELNGDAA